ncbi:probable glutamate--tRNA ligase, mitochondrial [Mizuhopecten yessoensis]|uniref:Nondiscriminating glutamyl-tRNA synthetase EARS2, mitochondrial n=1 Tax=Mizuhopecten yessoensis TaxID=6573 RepID=A0A210R0W7_MIZYE|nr:probable glutamate--tRNA ligase, mitochondrial [Mizuhopecten yessoensis]OWF54604.1 glutamate--tRNA ligase, mitochondrial [Mizuhopecten yessoensis]
MALPMRNTVFRIFWRKGLSCCRFSTGSSYFQHDLVRVRFAPSPTGYLHLGSLRTAFYNYCQAKSRKGVFILRIEDTDQTRKVEGATESIMDDLDWAGIPPDEGPLVGGNYGPYIQSERKHIYLDAIETLLKKGAAYPCFCSENRLKLLRKEATRRKEIPKYDNKCRSLSTDEIEEKKSQGIPWVVRLRVDDWSQSWDDKVYGHIVINHNEGDPVLLKADGYPTYHFANVVDDHHMKITHVLRGEEWHSSTPKHLALYQAFGWDPPALAHLPLILNPNGTKLSKRQGDIGVDYFKRKGYAPLVLLNYLTLTGGGFKTSATYPVCFPLEQLIQKFHLKNVTSHSGRLGPHNLEILSRQYLLAKLETKEGEKELVQHTIGLIRDHYKNRLSDEELGKHIYDEEHICYVLKWALPERITRPEDLLGEQFIFLWEMPDKTDIADFLEKTGADCGIILNAGLEVVKTMEQVDVESIHTALIKKAKSSKIGVNKFMPVLRYVLFSTVEGPRVGEIISALGRKQSLYRLQRALDLIDTSAVQG